jgi:tetratricopeptide (TPR) repeat protein
VAWNTKKKQWFSLHPRKKYKPDDWLYWTNGAMNWNTMCADCHSTNLHQNYFPKADSFHTTWSSINVSCESCHGPGSTHIKHMKSRKGKPPSGKRSYKDLYMTHAASSKMLVFKCARCHSRREKLVPVYHHNESFLDQFDPVLPHPPHYFADGQIKDEDYIYSSFLQSKMFHNGVSCMDCHDPHTLKLKKNVFDNSLCMQCHARSFNSTEHTHHKLNTKASECVSCHMPGRYYMQVDFRRDHSLRIPRPDLSVKFGTPNACNSCHTDKSKKWAANAVQKWFGESHPNDYYRFHAVWLKASKNGAQSRAELESLIADTSQSAMARATAIWYLGQFPNRDAVKVLKGALTSSNPLVRNSAVKAVGSLPSKVKKPLLTDVLDDSVRAVRISAAEALASFHPSDFSSGRRSAFKKALDEYKKELQVNQYFPSGQMNRGEFFEKKGQTQNAIQAYRKALKKDPKFNPARINLALLMNKQGNNAKAIELLKTVIEQEPDYGPAYYSMALLLSRQKKLKQAVSYFQKAAKKLPDNDRVRYNEAIAFQKLKRPKQAEQAYLAAIKLAPKNPEYRYGICTLYMQQKEYDKALPQAQKLAELRPNSRRAQQLLRIVQSKK